MPYIKQEDRPRFDDVAKVIGERAECAGDLNYAITVILHTYLKKKGLKYANCNEIVGMMECCKAEFYRKVVGPYEETCIAKNGDVVV
jgi:hypothetical protein